MWGAFASAELISGVSSAGVLKLGTINVPVQPFDRWCHGKTAAEVDAAF
jgi:hypothetical protein